MDGQGEATAVADRCAIAGDGGPAIASVGDDDTGEIAVRVADGDRHCAYSHMGAGVPAGCPEFWRDRCAGAEPRGAACRDGHRYEREGSDRCLHLGGSAGHPGHNGLTQSVFAWFQRSLNLAGAACAAVAPADLANALLTTAVETRGWSWTTTAPTHRTARSDGLWWTRVDRQSLLKSGRSAVRPLAGPLGRSSATLIGRAGRCCV